MCSFSAEVVPRKWSIPVFKDNLLRDVRSGGSVAERGSCHVQDRVDRCSNLSIHTRDTLHRAVLW